MPLVYFYLFIRTKNSLMLPLTMMQIFKKCHFRSTLCCLPSHVLVVSVPRSALLVLQACEAHTNCK